MGNFESGTWRRGCRLGRNGGGKEFDVMAMASSPDGKTVATGNMNGAVKLWNIDTGKVIKEWTKHIERLESVCWSPDGGRVVSGILGLEDDDGTFRVRDVENGETILGPIHCKAGRP
jgi:WD40 repeat protein